MSVQEVFDNMQRAADLLREETQPIANSAYEHVESLPGTAENQQRIQEEATQRAEEIQRQLLQLRANIDGLVELVDEGVQGGEKITSSAKNAALELNNAEPSLENVDSILAGTGIKDKSKFIPPLKKKREDAGLGMKTLLLMGEAHTADFAGAKELTEGLASEVAGLSERATELVARMGAIGTPTGCMIEFDYWNPSREVQGVTDFKETIPVTATAIGDAQVVIYDPKGASDFGSGR